MKDSIYADWNPWHGCTKISPGCKFCYVYRQDEMYGNPTASSRCTKNAAFDLPVQRGRGGSYKIPPGRIILTCFTSDFLLKDADPWRQDCWRMMRERSDCWFYFFTKRIDRLAECLPPDWGEGYDNVMIGCTVENQERADFRLPIFLSLPIKHRSVIVAPMLERVDLSKWLGSGNRERMPVPATTPGYSTCGGSAWKTTCRSASTRPARISSRTAGCTTSSGNSRRLRRGKPE